MEKFVEHEIEIANRQVNIQFRVFNLKTKTFYSETEKFLLPSTGDYLLTETGEKLSLKENMIQRCTGAKDIKGQLIYHGDILRTDEAGWHAAVVWGNGRFCLEDERGGYSAFPNWDSCEIIGNMFTFQKKEETTYTEEQEKAMDFWHACWNGDHRELKKMLPSCSMFINSNIEIMENGEKRILLLPLIAALNSRNERCIKLLLQYGAKTHKICKNMGETPWAFAKRRDFDGIPIMKLLAAAGKLSKKQKARENQLKYQS